MDQSRYGVDSCTHPGGPRGAGSAENSTRGGGGAARPGLPARPAPHQDNPRLRRRLHPRGRCARRAARAPRLRQHRRGGPPAPEAARRESGYRLVAMPDDPDLLEPVRARVHRVLLADAELLERYRTVEAEAAARLLRGAGRRRRAVAPAHPAGVRRGGAGRVGTPGRRKVRVRPRHARAARGTPRPRRPRPRGRRRCGRSSPATSRTSRWPRPPGMGRACGLRPRADRGREWPASLRTPVYSPLAGSPGFALGELLDTPLCSAELREGQVMIEEEEPVSATVAHLRGAPLHLPARLRRHRLRDRRAVGGKVGTGSRSRPVRRTKPRGTDNGASSSRRCTPPTPTDATAAAMSRSPPPWRSGRLLLAATGVVADGARQGDRACTRWTP